MYGVWIHVVVEILPIVAKMKWLIRLNVAVLVDAKRMWIRTFQNVELHER